MVTITDFQSPQKKKVGVGPLRFKIEKIVFEFNANSTDYKISLEIRILKISNKLQDNMISKSHLHNILTKCSTKLLLFPPGSCDKMHRNKFKSRSCS